MEVARDYWDASEVKLIREDLINRKWKYKMKYIEQLPRYYAENGNIPFMSDRDINVCFNAVAFETVKYCDNQIFKFEFFRLKCHYLNYEGFKLSRLIFNLNFQALNFII